MTDEPKQCKDINDRNCEWNMKELRKLPIVDFCKLAGGKMVDVPNEAARVQLTRRGLFVEDTNLGVRACMFPAIHVNNDGDKTNWAPNIDNVISENGWRIKQLTKSARGCAKNDIDEVLGTDKEVREQFLERKLDDGEKLTKKQKEEFMNGRHSEFEEEFNDWVGREMEFVCGEDIWPDIEKTGQEAFTGNWKGDTHDNYDIGEVETLFRTDADYRDTVFSELEDLVDEIDKSEVTLPALKPNAWEIREGMPLKKGEKFHNHLRLLVDEIINFDDEKFVDINKDNWNNRMRLELSKVQIK